jgi:4-methylaminobutanoate oxidase (formaldehyde-forming)
MAWPSEEHASGRPNRRSPLYDRLKARGAVFGEKLGWERPNWFAAPGEEPRDVYTYGRPNWFGAVAREHRAAREAAVLIDQTSFAKFVLKGPDAEAALQWIAANDVGKPPGALVYTQMLNDRAGIEADLTVARIAHDEYYVVTGTGFATRDFDWIARGIPEGAGAQLVDVTGAWSALSLMGPLSREILSRVTRADLSTAAFPFASWREIGIAGAPVRALRVTYVGELGWELHAPVECAATVYDALTEAGRPFGLRDAGYRAIETLRLEKGYRAWGAELGPDHAPDEAGLGWAVKLRTDIPFRGREAALAQRREGVRKRLAIFHTDADVVLNGRETIYRNGERCGWLSSAGYGHAVGRWIGMGYVRGAAAVTREHVLAGRYDLEVASARIPCAVSLAPLHDPEGARVRA